MTPPRLQPVCAQPPDPSWAARVLLSLLTAVSLVLALLAYPAVRRTTED
jgi:hypothetical protein